MSDDEIREWDRQKLKLGLLEGRRAASDGFMWQAPVLTLAVQAFLLRILADDISSVVATAVAVGGALATSAAALALFLLHDRELSFGERVDELTAEMKLGEIRRPPSGRSRDHPLELKGYVLWAIVLASFVMVDAVVLGATHGWWLVLPVFAAVAAAYGIAEACSVAIREREDEERAR